MPRGNGRRGFGRGFGAGRGYGRGLGPNPYPYCRWNPNLPRGWRWMGYGYYGYGAGYTAGYVSPYVTPYYPGASVVPPTPTTMPIQNPQTSQKTQ